MKFKKQLNLKRKRPVRAWTLASRLEKRKIKNKKIKKK
jgi:hypothetical protein